MWQRNYHLPSRAISQFLHQSGHLRLTRVDKTEAQTQLLSVLIFEDDRRLFYALDTLKAFFLEAFLARGNAGRWPILGVWVKMTTRCHWGAVNVHIPENALCVSIADFLSLKWSLGKTDGITSNLPSFYLMHVNVAKQHSAINWKVGLRSALILTECWPWSYKGCCTHNIWTITCPNWSRSVYFYIYRCFFHQCGLLKNPNLLKNICCHRNSGCLPLPITGCG